MSRFRGGGVALLILAALTSPATAQSLTGGAVVGIVDDGAGLPVFDVIVTLEPVAGGLVRADTTLRDGRFAIDYLPPGEYDILAERLGYRPQRVQGVVVHPGRTVRVPMQILEIPGTPESADVVRWDGGITSAGAAGLAVSATRLQLSRLPAGARTLEDASRFSSFLGPDLSARGLPGIHTGFVIDGVPVRGGRHPLLGSASARASALRLSAFDQIEVLIDEPDAELSGFAGAMISAHGRRGGRELRIDGFADVSAGALSTSTHFEPADVGGTRIRAGAVLSGPIVPDTAHFTAGLEIGREEIARPALLDAELSETAAALLERLGEARAPLGEPFAGSLETISGFGSVDWQITQVHRLGVRADLTRIGAAEPELAGGGLLTTSSGTDILLGGALTSRIGTSSLLEFRFGLDRSSREYAPADDGLAVPFTAVASGSLGFGTPASLNGDFSTTSLFLSESFLSNSDSHHLKLGAGVWLSNHERSAVPSGAEFFFANAVGPTGGAGYSLERTAPVAPSFSTRQFFAFLQDSWNLSSEIDLLLGVRAEYELLPLDDIPLDVEWRSISGLDNVESAQDPDIKIAPRVGFTWDVGGEGRYFVRGSGGIYHEMVDPDILAEVIADAGQRRLNIRTGSLGGWPDAPVGGEVTELRMTSILAPGFRAPRSERGSLGVGVALGGGLALDATGTYGRTTGLVRRTDLNRLPGTVALDQDGRPVFGELVKSGSLLYARPGSNRRFSTFDHVYAIDSDGTADQLSISAGLERSVESGTMFFARYTWSRTTDDWLHGGLVPRDLQLSPFPEETAWDEGTAAFDVPHRVAAGIDLPVPGTPVRFAGFYRFESGRAFTPGFPLGVDANGDGVFGNDPAAAGGDLAGLTSAWPCLRESTDGFVDRNACRDPDVHRVDLRVSADLPFGDAANLTVFVDALDLTEADLAIRDHALYRLDPAAPLQSSEGSVTVPLIVNSAFGEPLVRLSSGRTLRFGLRLRY